MSYSDKFMLQNADQRHSVSTLPCHGYSVRNPTSDWATGLIKRQSLTALRAVVPLILSAFLVPPTASAIPAFARLYATSCMTCHIDFPKLNDFGKAFKDAGFQFPKRRRGRHQNSARPAGRRGAEAELSQVGLAGDDSRHPADWPSV